MNLTKFGSFHEKFVWPRPYTREIYIATRLGVRLTQKPEINQLSSPFEWLLVKPQSKSSPEGVITRALVFLPKQEVLNPGERLSAAAIIGDLKIEVFRHFPATRERQEVTWPGPCRQVCCLTFTFVPLDHAPEVIYRKVFCTLRHHNPTFEKKYDFLELFRLLIIEFSFKKT